MSWSLTIGSSPWEQPFGYNHVHPFLAGIFARATSRASPNAAWSSILFMVFLFICVLTHEFGHILNGARLRRLTRCHPASDLWAFARWSASGNNRCGNSSSRSRGRWLQWSVCVRIVLVRERQWGRRRRSRRRERPRVSMVDPPHRELFLALLST